MLAAGWITTLGVTATWIHTIHNLERLPAGFHTSGWL
jgi:hypothetical protein